MITNHRDILLLLLATTTSHAFVIHTSPLVRPSALGYNNNKDDLLGDVPSNEDLPSALKDRLQDLRRQEQRHAAVEGRNWNMANWKESGIAWNATVTSVQTAIDDDDEPMLVVGDANGIVTCIQLVTNGVPSQSVLEDAAPIDYQVLQQWKACEGAVKLLTSNDDYVYTSDGNTIQQWSWDATDDSEQPAAIMISPCHTLQSILSDDRLVSVHSKGVSIWSSSGKLIGEYKTDDSSIECAAVNDDRVSLGMANGDVLVHSLQAILDGQPSVLGRWRATGDDSIGLSAISFGGETRIGSQMVTVIFTGDSAGNVKQWFLLPQADGSVQPWPKLSSQRLPQKSHLFAGHTEKVQSILAIDGVKFVSTSVDSTVKGWNTATGKEIFSMEGFPGIIDSLATIDGFLVTNGMEQYLPLNDFTVDDDEFDLDMPEYI